MDPLQMIHISLKEAFVLRQHAKYCPMCEIHGTQACPTAVAIVEDALSMTGLFDRNRTNQEKKP